MEIYQYDNSPLGDRKPLLLIHGLIGEFHPLFRWGQLAKYLSQNQAFQQQYKIYLVRYNTHSSLKEITEAFKHKLHDLAPAGGLTIVAISMSGTIVRNAMRDPTVEQSIARVVTLGAFFRGSPLFCSDWMQQSIRKRHLSPLCRIQRSLGYKIYFAHHKNLLRSYGWDNVDGQMPAVTAASLSRMRAHGEEASSQLVTATPQPGDDKFVVYAGFLHNQYTPPRRSAAHSFLISPLTFLWTTLPANLGREHQALRFLNNLIAGAIPSRADDSSIIYPLNDGISPISSSLLLSDDFVAHSAIRNQADIESIGTHSKAKRARLFESVDHLTFIEAQRPIGSAEAVADLLSPTDKPRSMFAWILKDLLE